MNSEELYRTTNSSALETTTYTATSSTVDAAAVFAILAPLFVVTAIILVVQLIASWKVYAKAGEAGWKALIPIYNAWVFLRMGNQPAYWAVLALIPIVNIVSIVFMILAAINIGKKFGKQDLFVLLYILLPIVWFLILAFGKATWNGEKADSNTPDDTPEVPDFTPPTTESEVAEPTETTPPTQQ